MAGYVKTPAGRMIEFHIGTPGLESWIRDTAKSRVVVLQLDCDELDAALRGLDPERVDIEPEVFLTVDQARAFLREQKAPELTLKEMLSNVTEEPYEYLYVCKGENAWCVDHRIKDRTSGDVLYSRMLKDFPARDAALAWAGTMETFPIEVDER